MAAALSTGRVPCCSCWCCCWLRCWCWPRGVSPPCRRLPQRLAVAQKNTQLQLVAVCELCYVDHRGGILQAAAVEQWGYQGVQWAGGSLPLGTALCMRSVVQVRACWDAIACCKNIREIMRGALASPSLLEERGWGSALATTAALSTALRRPPPLPACRSTSSTGLYDQRFSPSLKVLQVAVRGRN